MISPRLTKITKALLDHLDRRDEAKHPLTWGEMELILDGQAGVYRYDELFAENRDLQTELRRWPWKAGVFLFRTSPTFGHWMCVWEDRRGRLHLFDPYGRTEPDRWHERIPKPVLRRLGEEMPLLLMSAQRSYPAGLEWNDRPFQRLSPDVQTCGRWCLLRLWKRALSEEGFDGWVHRQCEKWALEPDTLAVYLTELM